MTSGRSRGRSCRVGARSPRPTVRRTPTARELRLEGVREHNLQNVTVDVPLGLFVCVTGVSGSRQVHARAGRAAAGADAEDLPLAGATRAGTSGSWAGSRSTRSSTSTSPRSGARRDRTRRRTPGCSTTCASSSPRCPRPSSVATSRDGSPSTCAGGRCEHCAGDGQIKIEMHFLPDVYVTCEVCKGRRYNRETLEVKYKGRSIADVLEMSVDEALEFFQHIPPIKRHMQTLSDVGLGYVRARTARADALGRRGAAHQAQLRAPQAGDRQHDVRARRADDRAALRGHPQAAGRAAAARLDRATPCS